MGAEPPFVPRSPGFDQAFGCICYCVFDLPQGLKYPIFFFFFFPIKVDFFDLIIKIYSPYLKKI